MSPPADICSSAPSDHKPPVSVRTACSAPAPGSRSKAGGKEVENERWCGSLEQFAFAAQISSSSTCSTALDVASSDYLSRQCTEIDALAQVALSDSAVEDIVREATADCQFSATVADPRRSDFPLIAVSAAFEKMTGYKREEIIGKNCRFLNHNCAIEPATLQALRESCYTGTPFTALLLNRRKSGDLFLNLLDLRGLTVAHNPRTGQELWFLVGIQADVSELAEADYPEDHLPKLRQVAAAVRERITAGLSNLAMAGALVAEVSAPTRSPDLADLADSWFPLTEPRWRSEQPVGTFRQALRASPPLPTLAATPPEEIAPPEEISPADSPIVQCSLHFTESLAQKLETERQQQQLLPQRQPEQQEQEDSGAASLLVAGGRATLTAAVAISVTAALVKLMQRRS